MRRATLRGRQILNKRFKLAAAFYNFSQVCQSKSQIAVLVSCSAGTVFLNEH
jgi:hypothetical protein